MPRQGSTASRSGSAPAAASHCQFSATPPISAAAASASQSRRLRSNEPPPAQGREPSREGPDVEPAIMVLT